MTTVRRVPSRADRQRRKRRTYRIPGWHTGWHTAHWIAHQGHSRRQGQMLVQTSSPPHHCSSGSTKSLPPGVLQPEPAPAPTGGPTTNSYIAQPGTAYASAGHGHCWTPQPRLYPHTRTRHATDAAAFHTRGSAPNPQSWTMFLKRLLQTGAADPIPHMGDTKGFVPQQLHLQPPPSNRDPSTNPIRNTPPHHGRNRPLLQGHPVHHRPVRCGYRRTGFKSYDQNAVVTVTTIDMSQVFRRAAHSPSRTPTRNPRQRF